MDAWHIIYLDGDRTRLTLVVLVEGVSPQLSGYAVASRRSFLNPALDCACARNLAAKHKLVFVPPAAAGAKAAYLD